MATRHFTWDYQDYRGNIKRWTYSIDIPEKLIIHVHSLHKPDGTLRDIKTTDIYDHPYVYLATYDREEHFFRSWLLGLLPMGKDAGYRVLEIAEWLLNFVAFIPYSPDPMRDRDYPRYPTEMLYDKRGDCEDAAILTARIWWTLGFDVALIDLPRHMAVGIALPRHIGVAGLYYWKRSRSYYYAEAAGTTGGYPGIRRIGQQNPIYKGVGAYIYPLPPHPNPLLKNPQAFWDLPQIRKRQTFPIPKPKPRPSPQPEIPSKPVITSPPTRILIWTVVLIAIILGWYIFRSSISHSHELVTLPGTPQISYLGRSSSTPSKHVTRLTTISTTSPTKPTYQAWVFAYKLNVRSAPNPQASVQSTLQRYEIVDVISKHADATWVKIVRPHWGWVNSVYLCYINYDKHKDTYLWVYAPKGLNLRNGPGTSYHKITALSFKRCVTVVEVDYNHRSMKCKQGWVRIVLPREGWLCRDWLTENPDNVLK